MGDGSGGTRSSATNALRIGRFDEGRIAPRVSIETATPAVVPSRPTRKGPVSCLDAAIALEIALEIAPEIVKRRQGLGTDTTHGQPCRQGGHQGQAGGQLAESSSLCVRPVRRFDARHRRCRMDDVLDALADVVSHRVYPLCGG
ncbi:hypothetical protein ABE957_03860 [Halomonas sp. CS7]|uniref:Uncharacterized protein n=1 Tax=Halomonas pelophila TaxID=3151122 RepID=A0ABV1N5T8_9GAMM